MVVIEGRTYECGINLDVALDRMLRAGLGILEVQRLPDGRVARWRVQSSSDPTQPHVVEAHWNVEGSTATLRCDCRTAWRLCCSHRAAAVQLLMVEAGQHGKHNVHTQQCTLCSATIFEARKGEDTRAEEQRWRPSPFAPARSSRAIRLSLAQDAENARQAAQEAPGAALAGEVVSRISPSERPRQQAHSASERPYTPPADLTPEQMRRNALEALATRRESSMVARPLVPVGIFK